MAYGTVQELDRYQKFSLYFPAGQISEPIRGGERDKCHAPAGISEKNVAFRQHEKRVGRCSAASFSRRPPCLQAPFCK